MSLNIFTLILGIAIGIPVGCRLAIALARHRLRTAPTLESWCRPEESPLALSHQPSNPLIRTRRCPEGYSAAQILGYHQIGRDPIPSAYPGGREAWFAEHTTQRREDNG